MSVIYLESTINLLISFSAQNNKIKEKVEKLIQSRQVKETESGIKYLKV